MHRPNGRPPAGFIAKRMKACVPAGSADRAVSRVVIGVGNPGRVERRKSTGTAYESRDSHTGQRRTRLTPIPWTAHAAASKTTRGPVAAVGERIGSVTLTITTPSPRVSPPQPPLLRHSWRHSAAHRRFRPIVWMRVSARATARKLTPRHSSGLASRGRVAVVPCLLSASFTLSSLRRSQAPNATASTSPTLRPSSAMRCMSPGTSDPRWRSS